MATMNRTLRSVLWTGCLAIGSVTPVQAQPCAVRLDAAADPDHRDCADNG